MPLRSRRVLAGVLAWSSATAAGCFVDSGGDAGGSDPSTAGNETTPTPGTGDTAVNGTAGSTEAADDTTVGEPSTTTDADADSDTGQTTTAWQQPLTLVEVPAANGGDPLTDVPILVRLTDSRFDYAAAQPDGSDLRFVAAVGERAALPHEIEHWDPEGTSLVWVRLPTLDEVDALWMLYGETGIPAADPHAVWSDDFVGVWHFDAEDGPTAGFADSTALGHPLESDAFDAKGISQTAGPNASGRALSLTDAARLRTDTTAPLSPTASLSVEAWVWPQDVTPIVGAHRMIMSHGPGYRLGAVREETGGPFANIQDVGGMQVTAVAPTLNPDGWTYVVGTFNGQDVQVFIDGMLVDSASASGDAVAPNTPFFVGTQYAGLIDELRVASTARTPQWVEIQHRSMLDELIEYGEATPL